MIIDYSGLPERLRGGMQRYIESGILPGSFLQAVLANNLLLAIGRADDENLAGLKDIMGWMINQPPGSCWGSQEAIYKWTVSGFREYRKGERS